MNDDGVFTVVELSRYLKTSVRQCWRWNDAKIIPPPIRIGGHGSRTIRWRKQEIFEWLRDGCPNVRLTNWKPSDEDGNQRGGKR